MPLSARNRRMLRAFGKNVRVLVFKDLPDTHYRAIEVYHGNVDAPLPRPTSKFGVATLPIDILTDVIMQDRELGEFDTWDEYHAWYLSHGGVPRHRTRWPVILSPTDDQTLEDGWHRLHAYYRDGFRTVPVVWYA